MQTWRHQIDNNNSDNVAAPLVAGLREESGINWNELITATGLQPSRANATQRCQTNEMNTLNNIHNNSNSVGVCLLTTNLSLGSEMAPFECSGGGGGDGAGLHLGELDDPQGSNDGSGGLSMFSNNNDNNSSNNSGDSSDNSNENSRTNSNSSNNNNNSSVNTLENDIGLNSNNNNSSLINSLSDMHQGLSFGNTSSNMEDRTFLGMPMSMDSTENFGLNGNRNSLTNLVTSRNTNGISNGNNSNNIENINGNESINNSNNNNNNNSNNSDSIRTSVNVTTLLPGFEDSLSQHFSKSLSMH